MKSSRRAFLLKGAAISGVAALSSTLSPLVKGQLKNTPAGQSIQSKQLVSKPELLADAVKVNSQLRIDPRIWNWRSDVPNNAPMPANYYEAALAPWKSFGTLTGDHQCDVVVIGGGLLGASAALHLAESGMDVVLLEKDNIGSGASGRNGGQTTPGLARWDATNMVDTLSYEDAKRLWRFTSIEACNLIEELSSRYGFQCDRKRGHVSAAIHPGHMGPIVSNADARRWLGDNNLKIIGPHELKEEYIRSNIYYGGAIDSIGGQVQPLALLRGLVYGFVQQGGKVYDHTEVQSIKEEAGRTVVVTKQGSVVARKAVVLAVHGSTFKFLSGQGSSTTIPFFTYVGVTAPLKEDARKLLLPTDYPVYDTQLQVDYYRIVRNNRLLFGGQGTGNSWSPRDVNLYLLGRIKRVFPQIEQPTLEYSWGGISDITLNGATDARKSHGSVPIYVVHGWSGHGVAQTVRIGKAISDDLMKKNTDFLMLTKIDHQDIPLGRYLSPIAIPVAKGVLMIKSAINPAELVSF